jgi:hypothetical protein
LVEQAATRTNTKLLLITNHDTDRGVVDRLGGDGVTVLQESLPWAQHLGTPSRNAERDTVIDRARHHIVAAGPGIDSPVHAEVKELLARHTHLTRGYHEEVTARDRYFTDMAQRSRDRDRSLSRDDGLEL